MRWYDATLTQFACLTNMKNTADPMATEAGVRAAILAQTGYTGPIEVFEGKEGLFKVIRNVK